MRYTISVYIMLSSDKIINSGQSKLIQNYFGVISHIGPTKIKIPRLTHNNETNYERVKKMKTTHHKDNITKQTTILQNSNSNIINNVSYTSNGNNIYNEKIKQEIVQQPGHFNQQCTQCTQCTQYNKCTVSVVLPPKQYITVHNSNSSNIINNVSNTFNTPDTSNDINYISESKIDVNKKVKIELYEEMNNESIFFDIVKNGFFFSLKFMINNGIDLSITDFEGKSALYHACEKGHTEIVKLILEHYNLNVDQVTNHGTIPLMIAVFHNHIDIVKELLKYTKEINFKNENGSTPLVTAVIMNNFEIVKMLIEYGGHNIISMDALYHACFFGYYDIVIYLFDLCKNKNDNILINTAAINGHINIVNFLLTKGIEIKKLLYHCNGMSICYAIMVNYVTGKIRNKTMDDINYLVKLFIFPEVINYQNIHGINLLFIASVIKNYNLIEYLLDNGAEDLVNKRNENALIYSIKKNFFKVVDLLVNKYHAKKNNVNLLQIASYINNKSFVEYLLKHGAKDDIVNRNNNNALTYAVCNNNFDIVKLLCDEYYEKDYYYFFDDRMYNELGLFFEEDGTNSYNIPDFAIKAKNIALANNNYEILSYLNKTFY